MGLANRVAVVTGAGRGIGRQVAEDLLAEGCHVVACARTGADLESLANAVPGPAKVLAFPVDVGETDATDRIVAPALDGFGRLDVVVNNGGGPVASRLDRMTDERWRPGFEIDFFAAARLSVAARWNRCARPVGVGS